MCLQIFGNGSIAQAVLNGSADRGEVMTIHVGWAVGVMIGAYVSIGVTGGHMNPAVTFAMALRGKLSWIKVKYCHVCESVCIYIYTCVENSINCVYVCRFCPTGLLSISVLLWPQQFCMAPTLVNIHNSKQTGPKFGHF